MITVERAAWQTKYRDADFCGLSSDEKPLVYSNGKLIDNGSVFYEMDTCLYYRFDRANKKWIKQ